jgi:hypothetical protein
MLAGACELAIGGNLEPLGIDHHQPRRSDRPVLGISVRAVDHQFVKAAFEQRAIAGQAAQVAELEVDAHAILARQRQFRMPQMPAAIQLLHGMQGLRRRRGRADLPQTLAAQFLPGVQQQATEKGIDVDDVPVGIEAQHANVRCSE